MQEPGKKECFIRGALSGLSAWLIYAITEIVFSSFLPWLIKPSHLYKPLHWGFNSLLMLFVYPVTGMVTGGVLALLISMAVERKSVSSEIEDNCIIPAAGSLAIVLIFSLNLVFISVTGNTLSLFDRPVIFALLLSFIIAVSLLFTASSATLFKKLRFVLNPAVICFLLIGTMWANEEIFNTYTFFPKIILNIVYVSVVIFSSLVIHKAVYGGFPGTSAGSKVLSRPPLFALFVFIVILIGLDVFLVQKPLITPQPERAGHSFLEGPNLILVVLDTVRADHLSLYGYERETAPKLRMFAEEAVVYEQAVSPGNMTLSSHASMFTGYSVRRHGAHEPFPGPGPAQPLDSEFETLAEILSGKGYSTLAVVSNISYLSPSYGLHQGFEHYDSRSRVPFLVGTYPYLLRQGIRNLFTYMFPPSTYDLVCRRAETINRHVFNLLMKAGGGTRPFFMFINYMDAHRPYIPPPPFDNLFPGKNDEVIPARYFFPMKKEIMTFKRDISAAERNHLISQYDGAIAYMDFHIGKLLEKLKALGLYDNSIIIITSDHGELFGDRNLIEHGISVYQSVVHVPLIIKYPDSDEGTVNRQPVNLTDIMPIVLDRLKHEKTEGSGVENQNSSIRTATKDVISESYPSRYHADLHESYRNIETALYSGKYKFISSTSGKREIFDISIDPYEKNNIYSKGGSISNRMEADLNSWFSRVRKYRGVRKKIDNDTQERLKSLGYIQ